MEKIAFVVPYISGGKMPNYFPIWLETCRQNPTVDFLLFMDDKTEYDYPPNVKVHMIQFCDLVELFQRHFDFALALDKPYKLCDFKPTYGEIFSDYLEDYAFWGHCDIDLFWGDIRKFLTDEIFASYERIYTRGHCCLYRNKSEINAWYRTLSAEKCPDWKTVFQSPKLYCFDEWGGMSKITSLNGKNVYDQPDMADLDVSRGFFKAHRWENQDKIKAFRYSKGKLTALGENEETIKEVLYVHFQKRKIMVNADSFEEFFFCAPGIVSDHIQRDREGEILFRMDYMRRRVLRKIQKITAGY